MGGLCMRVAITCVSLSRKSLRADRSIRYTLPPLATPFACSPLWTHLGEVEGEQRFRQLPALDERLKDRFHAVDRDGGVREPEDAVELGDRERDPRLRAVVSLRVSRASVARPRRVGSC